MPRCSHSGRKMADLRQMRWLTLGLLVIVAALLAARTAPSAAAWQHSTACEAEARALMYRLVQDPAALASFDTAADALGVQCPPPTMAAGSWPILANLFMQRGNHAWGQEQWDTAGTSYRLAVAYAPQQAPAHRRLAEVLLYHQQQPGAALAQLEVAVALDPADGYGYILKAHAYAALNDLPRALEEAQRAVTAANTGYAYLVQGDMLARLGRWSEAIASYQESIQLDPESGVTFYQLGHALQAVGRRQEAQAAWQEAQRLDPSFSIPGS